ncbi:hypothetical protein TruAng_010435 [Truncatella angustata]|nr:hypothetical protein TruAng_010435 [Truncatella angustata]
MMDSQSANDQFAKPRPRVPRSPAQAAQVRKQNRRQEYLQRHPSYFESLEHELAAEEREEEGKTKGYSRVLEVDLLRGEAKLQQLAAAESSTDQAQQQGSLTDEASSIQPLGAAGGEPETKEGGRQTWDNYLRERFVLGRDEDFDYDPIDADDSLDTMEKRDEEDAWFDDQKPEWASDKDENGNNVEKQLHGETGIQDF